MKALIIDDEQIMREIMELILSHANINFDTAKNGMEAVSLAAHKKYDIILVDLMMPIMSGFEVIRRIRKKDKNTPIITLSALSDRDSILQAINLGANDYLAKPFERSTLISKMETLVALNDPANLSATNNETTANVAHV